MKILRNPVFITAAITFWVTYTLEHFKIFTLPFVHHYLDDLLAMPVILTLAVAVQRQWVYRSPQYTLSKAQIIFAVLYVSVLFEGILPAFSAKYTRDVWDVSAYIFGAWVFYRFINQRQSIPLRPQP
ncbi:magnesium citrate secondary transporter [Adhaeribacter radiodurans]|uniref:Magnesium citrate secondary transporter n=1 Tax=Adhaeribacter radiodurans TaxID=2745197 RepID=A0A7L7LER5_9BACT|nr:magnesium citrate secondary transporter [Adhaeribacter radiodurans]QMU31338.1 magnesium citrate secondary transporter [Adhaeribacter radiodurans]